MTTTSWGWLGPTNYGGALEPTRSWVRVVMTESLAAETTMCIYGGSGDDEMRGGRGNDIIIDDTNEDDAEGGADQLFGGNGDDWMLAGNGNDDVLEGATAVMTVLIGGNGNDDAEWRLGQRYSHRD